MNSQEHTQQVYVVGSQQLQNALLTEFLVKEDVAAKSIPTALDITTEILREKNQNLFGSRPGSGKRCSDRRFQRGQR